MTQRTFNFSANAIDFGNWPAKTQEEAQDQFASDAGYKSWEDMLDRTKEFDDSTVEVREVTGE